VKTIASFPLYWGSLASLATSLAVMTQYQSVTVTDRKKNHKKPSCRNDSSLYCLKADSSNYSDCDCC